MMVWDVLCLVWWLDFDVLFVFWLLVGWLLLLGVSLVYVWCGLEG